ncbi:family 18 glycosyl hydrolase [Hypoxylon trugodes]|uniref:family 18 glycosyl hydrolase n=1 Tax=Hypoxylon trugodes TaxID=326681 RepID=UPI00219E61C0|nr:family 18 glycosyl hydrolase [Hypoxylon trugodes]KAI1382677.1 family 18 glycosyl hydrolase [Hypoxylon trugodes]
MFFFLVLLYAIGVSSVPYKGIDIAGVKLNHFESATLLSSSLLDSRALPVGTCNADTPCDNAACCGGKNNNLCGYSPGECGTGFGGCGDVNRPSCGGNSIAKRTIGYYEAWSATRKCQAATPEDLNLNGFTHINFAFAFFDPKSFEIAPMDSSTGVLLGRFTALKDKHTGLETWVSVGGWSFTDPGPTRSAFSEMTSSAGNRKKFIGGLISFMDHYGFDGVDLDWEYPQADDRGGITADKANYVSLVKELRSAFGDRYGISLTLPTSYWYLQHFDLGSIHANVDWFNFMTYDLHGVWDAQSKALGPHIAPHTNVTEIDMGLDLLWRAGVPPAKVVLGLGWYGRSFTLSDPSCNTPNGVCEFSGGANAGPCSDASGILTLQEIKDVISTNKLNPVWDKTAEVKWITWDSNQWVSYDDDDTFDQKRKFANSRCLGGTMIWAMDQVDQNSDNGLAPAPGITTQDQADAKQSSDDIAAGITCYTTDCNESCKKGTNEVAQMNGQPGKLSTNDRCKANQYRSLCCADGTRMGTCQWRGYRGVGLSCMGGCDDGETEVVQDTNSHQKSGDRTCTGGIQSFCCKDFKPSPSVSDLKDKAVDAAKEAAEAAAEQAALDIAAKAFCRLAVPALLAPLELIEAAIPIFGEIADIAEIAATPALIQLCVKGVEKEGKAVFKVFGKKHTLTLDKPSATRESRPPESSHTRAKTSSDSCPKNMKRADCIKPLHKTTITEIVDNFRQPPDPIICDGDDSLPLSHPQACLNYRSIIQHNPGYATLTCPYYPKPDGKGRPVSKRWTQQRNLKGYKPFMEQQDCSPDEYPPAAICDFNDGWAAIPSKVPALDARPLADRGQKIRLLDAQDNKNAGNLFAGCKRVAEYDLDRDNAIITKGPGRRAVETTLHRMRAVYNRRRFTMDFVNLPNLADDGLQDNECQPEIDGTSHPGFVLLNEDQWFNAHPAEAASRAGWASPPSRKKRDWVEALDKLVIVDSNSTRAATPAELRDEFGFEDCADETCSRELEALRAIVATVRERAFPTAPLEVEAAATASATTAAADADGVESPSRPGSDFVGPAFPARTGRADRGN